MPKNTLEKYNSRPDALPERLYPPLAQCYIRLPLPKVFISLAFSTLLISACSDGSQYDESSADMESVQSVSEEVSAEQMYGVVSESAETATDAASNTLSIDNLSGHSEQNLGSPVADIQIKGKELLITASADFKVEDVVKSSHAIESLTQQQGGYVAVSEISNQLSDSRSFIQGDKNITLMTYYRQATMSVRVPRANVNKFLQQVQQQVAFLNAQSFKAQDVTLDIYREQLAAQLNLDMAAELSRERLNSHNDKDQGSNVDAITATYAARQQQQYAQLQQMEIADRVKYSTIDLSFTQPDISYKEVTQNLEILIDAERPSFIAQVQEAFKAGAQMLRSAILGLIQLWWFVVLGGILYLFYRIIKLIYLKFTKQPPRPKPTKRERVIPNAKDNNDDPLV